MSRFEVGFLAFLWGCAIGSVFGAYTAFDSMESVTINTAIKANYAHYHPKTGEVVWDKCKELKP